MDPENATKAFRERPAFARTTSTTMCCQPAGQGPDIPKDRLALNQ
jgi:hypothetical protein